MARRSKKKNKRKKTRSKKKSRRIKRFKKKVRKIKSTKSRGGRSKKNIIVKDEEGNSVIKVSEAWSNQALINNSKYKKNIIYLLKKMINFGKKREKELPGLSHTPKLRM